MDDQCQLNTKIAEDGLSAMLIVPESFNRAQLTPELCEAMLMRSSIELTVDTKERVRSFIEKAKAAPPGIFHDIISTGIKPIHGQDGAIEWMLDALKDAATNAASAPAPESDAESDTEPEVVSFYDQSIYTVVKAGDILGKTFQPTPGTDGRTVIGKNIAARDGKALDFKHDESIMIGKGNLIIAQADGLLDRSGNAVCIRDTIDVDENVDFNTGNIAFKGNVVVRKGVRDCFKIDATGDVEVHGLIEAATIIAGGELRALGGFAGRERGTAQVAGNLRAKYLDAVQAKIRGDLLVEREVINCNTQILGRINSPAGAIIGGQTQVAGRIEIGELGAEGLPLTTVQIGVVPHLDALVDELRAMADELAEERQKLLNEQETIQSTSGSRMVASHKERLCELMYEIAEVQSHLDRAEPSWQKACDKADSMRAIDVHVLKCVHPNTVLVCKGVNYRIKNEMKGPLRIFMDNKNQLKVERGDTEPTMLARQADLSDAA